MRLSIIVPVYNMTAEGKLEYCLNSLIDQTLKDKYEIIAVDDASTDNSLEILKEFEKRYPDKMRIISYPDNRHQGGAKNEGIKASTGEWIGFVDSDDWISPDYYEKLITRGEETGADIVGCCYSLVYEHTMEVGKPVRPDLTDITGDFTKEKRKKFLNNLSSMVTKVYRASLIKDNNLFFPEKIFYEDNAAGPVWAMYYKHFEYVDEPLYYYYQHGTSTVHTITEQRCMALKPQK